MNHIAAINTDHAHGIAAIAIRVCRIPFRRIKRGA